MGFDQHSTPSSAMDSQASTATAAGVSNCYVFKSRLQEYAQKAGLSTPVYETIKEGPSHEPTFRSTVIVNDVRYDSLPGFFNRKAAEQSAAEVALRKMAQSGEMKERVSQPVHESGLCKNLLQEYAQKMNYAMPLYECRKDEAPGRGTLFSCTVEIGEIKYIGGSARTKKEAEIKAARTALLAIESSASDSEAYDKLIENTEYTVFPFKKKPTNSGMSVQETAAVLKPKKRRLKKKPNKKKRSANGANHVKGKYTNGLKVNMDMPPGTETSQFDSIGAQVTDSGFQLTVASNNFQYGSENKENALVENKENALVFSNNGDSSPLSVLKDGDSKDVDQNVFQNTVI